MRLPGQAAERCLGDRRGSILIIVLWVAFGLVALALYFGQTMALELRAADNRVTAIEADQAIAGAVRYLTNILGLAPTPGQLPELDTYHSEAVPVGEARFWVLGRPANQNDLTRPVLGISDEGSRLDLNTATIEMLQLLPRMTPELAAAIVDWRDADSTVSAGGAEDETYLRSNPPYRCKNAPFESLDELRLVYGMTLEILYGEDANLNGVLDLNENDGDASPPADNRDGRLDPGLMEYLSVHTRMPTLRGDGTARIDLASGSGDQLSGLLQERLGAERANAIVRQIGDVPGGFRSLLEFYVRSRMTAEEFAGIESDLRVGGTNAVGGQVNVNTASEAVLACVPGIGIENASTVVARRLSNAGAVWTMAWVTEVLSPEQAIQAGPYLTGHSYQFSLDIAAVGHYGRGYRRVRFVCDTSGGAPRLVARRDLSRLGWALGREVLEEQLRLTGQFR